MAKPRPEQQKALEEAGKLTSRNHCEYVDREESKVITELQGFGVEPNDMAAGELAKLEQELEGVHTSWAKTLDDRGRPGSDVLAAFRSQLAGK